MSQSHLYIVHFLLRSLDGKNEKCPLYSLLAIASPQRFTIFVRHFGHTVSFRMAARRIAFSEYYFCLSGPEKKMRKKTAEIFFFTLIALRIVIITMN